MSELDQLKNRMIRSYLNISLGMAVIAFSFPIIIYLAGRAFGIELQPSLSDYYFAQSPSTLRETFDFPVRVLFVGGLFALGAFLNLYKGFTCRENMVLNVAGAFAAGVALFPMGKIVIYERITSKGTNLTLHGLCAVLLFVCMFYVAVWGKRRTLRLMKDPPRRYFTYAYNTIAGAMVCFIVIGMALNLLFGNTGDKAKDSTIFFVEAAGVWVFAAFWAVKTYEMVLLNRKVRTPKPGVQVDSEKLAF